MPATLNVAVVMAEFGSLNITALGPLTSDGTPLWLVEGAAEYVAYKSEKVSGTWVRRVLDGYPTGNAPPDTPHLHFTIFKLGPEKQWWKGVALNPFPLWALKKVG